MVLEFCNNVGPISLEEREYKKTVIKPLKNVLHHNNITEQ